MTLRLDAITPGAVTLIGVPSDENSSFLRGAAAAPAAIRSALYDPEANPGTEDGGSIFSRPRVVDAGDVRVPRDDGAAAFEAIVGQVAGALDRGAPVLALGGDHSISYPLVRAQAGARTGPFSVVQIDAHPDLYDDYQDNRFSHACPFARIMEEALPSRLVQIGIRAPTPHQVAQATRFGVETVGWRDKSPTTDRLPEGPVYLSIDLDGLDPAFAPGVSHPEPGGLSTRDVLRVIHELPGPLIGADIVELNPQRDVHGATARVAAKLVKEIAARLIDGAS